MITHSEYTDSEDEQQNKKLNIHYHSNEIEDSSTSTYYSFELCYKISDKFKIEFVSFSEILDLSDWKIQAYFRF